MTDRACSEPASFSGYDRRRLALTLTQTSDIRLFRRVPAVLRVAEGDPIRSGARALWVSGRSGPRWLEIYRHRRHPEDWLDAPRSGRPRAANDLEAEWLAERRAQDPRALGYRATTGSTPWLATPLQQEGGCPLSERTLRRRWPAGGWGWQRPRSVLAEREAAVGPKKGRFAAAR
jgi:transposase